MTLAVTFSRQLLFVGVVTGLVYAIVAVGLVLVYRASRVINLAQGQFGAFGALAMALLFVNYGIPYWATFPLALASGVVLGAATELLVVRRLFRQPRLLVMVATLGVAQLITWLMLQLPRIQDVVTFPTPIRSRVELLGITIRGDQLMVLLVVPLVGLALTGLLHCTRFGLQVRATADDPDTAALAGTNVKAVSTGVWALAGLLAAVSALLIGPVQHTNAGEVQELLGPYLLLRALTAAMFGRLVSIPLAVAGGVIVGVVELFVQQNFDAADTLVMFVLLVVLVLVRGRADGADDRAWPLVPRVRTAGVEVAELPAARWSGYAAVAALVAGGLFVPVFVTQPSTLIQYAHVLVFMTVAVSTVVLAGWGGQFSLGQFAFVGIGAYATAYYAAALPFGVAMALGIAWGAGIAAVIGLPALRVRGSYLAVITLGFAFACSGWLFSRPRLNSGGTTAVVDPPVLGRYDLQFDKRAYYYLTLAGLLAVTFLVYRFRRSGMGRSLIAVRDNQDAASTMTVSPTRMKLIAFALAGAIAAFAGGLWAAGNTRVLPGDFVPAASLAVVAIVVVGGMSSITGAVIGALVIVGIPTVFSDVPQLQLFGSAIGILVLLMYFPGGLISIVHGARDLFLGWLARRLDLEPPDRPAERTVPALASARPPAANGAAPLVTDGVTVHFGGRVAVDGVSIRVAAGEIVGLIGTNGAGKSTLMNAISGLVPARGSVALFGRRADHLAPHRRAELGVGRGFQDARLFAALTVRETLMVALEARSRSHLVPSILMLPPSPRQERRKRDDADEIVAYLGLGRYADVLVGELSTGTRRIVELGTLVALDARLLLLDEPTAGVAQREAEAFGPLVQAIGAELGAAVVLIEHDIGLVTAVSDRLYCLEAGRVIAEGLPAAVCAEPAVVASYLGTDDRALRRSNV